MVTVLIVVPAAVVLAAVSLGAAHMRRERRRRAKAADPWTAFEQEFWAYVERDEGAIAADELPRLRTLVHEGLVLCERADALLPEIRDDDGPAGPLAHRATPVVARLHTLREELLGIRSPELRTLAREAEALVNFYGQHLYHALTLLTTSWRHERLREQRERLGSVTWARDRLAEIADAVDRLPGATA